MFLSTMLLPAVLAQPPVEEPVWIGTEAVKRVSLNDRDLGPIRSSGPVDRSQLTPLILTAVNQLGQDPTSKLWLYEIRYVGLRAGEHDLRDYLNFPPGTNRQRCPPILVTVSDPLPPDHHGQLDTPPVLDPAPEAPSDPKRTVTGVAVGWVVGLCALGTAAWLKWRSRRVVVPARAPEDELVKQLHLAEVRLLTPQGLAALERELLDRWRRELGLAGGSGVALVRALETDPRGRALLTALEAWRASLESGPAPMPTALKEWAERTTNPPPGASP
jgi:hypothetical protein